MRGICTVEMLRRIEGTNNFFYKKQFSVKAPMKPFGQFLHHRS